MAGIGAVVDDNDEAVPETEQPKPKTFSEVMAAMQEQKAATAGDPEASLSDDIPEQGEEEAEVNGQESDTGSLDAPPEWVNEIAFPPNFKIPLGVEVFFVKIRAHLTRRPDLPDRFLVIWSLSVADERAAIKRSRGEPARMLPENTQQMIRLIDGKIATHMSPPPKGHALVAKLWEEIGPKYRQKLQEVYLKMHNLTDQEHVDFFGHCVAAASSVADTG